jgi:hypothetical protein
MKLLIKNLVLTCCLSWIASAIELTIDQPGIYELGASIVSLPAAGPDQIIVIASSDVIFDLGEFVIFQGNAVAEVDGILINSNLSDIVIRNGMIRGVTQTAISIGSGASRILIENMKVGQCAGGVLATSVTDLTIQGCQFTRCSSANPLINALDLIGSSRILLSDILISDANYSLSRILNANSISACTVQRMKIYSSATVVAGGIRLLTSQNVFFSDVTVAFCTNTSYQQIGNLNNILKNVSYLSNNQGGFIAITIENASQSNLVLQSVVNGTASLLGAIRFIDSRNNIIDSCSACANTTQNAIDQFQLILSGGDANLVRRSIALNNSSNLTSSGVFVAANATNTAIIDCLFNRNRGSTPANSFGAELLAGTNILFARNRAFSNNTTVGANQFSGVAGGAVTTVASTNINGSGSTPWTNLSVPA